MTTPDPIEPRPNVPLRSAELPWEEYGTPGRFGDRTLPLGAHGGATQVGFHIVELPPGKQGCPFHYHLREEEHFYVLSGRCVLRSGDERHEMGPGDYVCFPAGGRVGHATLNPFAEPCRMIVVGTRSPDDVCVYPDSGKAKVRSLAHMFPWPAPSLDYMHGEDDSPLPRAT
ncbi:MAG: cupin domain-containing protein [Planctomycetota bacterium]